jgi:hypothetical protein
MMHGRTLVSGWHAYPLLIGCGLLLAGCGPSRPETAMVAGHVTFRGKAVDSGRITFYPAQGRPATGAIASDGTYALTTFRNGDGAVMGKHRVTIEARRITGEPMPKTFAEEKSQLVPAGQRKVEWIVPEQFAQQDTSPLAAEVVRGGNTINFDLP